MKPHQNEFQQNFHFFGKKNLVKKKYFFDHNVFADNLSEYTPDLQTFFLFDSYNIPNEARPKKISKKNFFFSEKK